MTDKEMLRDELRNVMPSKKYGVSLEDSLESMPQFLSHYLREMSDKMIEKYPHRKDIIYQAYRLVIEDMSNESTWLTD